MDTIDRFVTTRHRLLDLVLAPIAGATVLPDCRSDDGRSSARAPSWQRPALDVRRNGASARAAARRERTMATLNVASRVMVVGGVLASLLAAI